MSHLCQFQFSKLLIECYLAHWLFLEQGVTCWQYGTNKLVRYHKKFGKHCSTPFLWIHLQQNSLSFWSTDPVQPESQLLAFSRLFCRWFFVCWGGGRLSKWCQRRHQRGLPPVQTSTEQVNCNTSIKQFRISQKHFTWWLTNNAVLCSIRHRNAR